MAESRARTDQVEAGIDPVQLQITDETLEEWQRLVDTMARLARIPAGLIMRLAGDDIEVFVTSQTNGNPYEVGAREHFHDSGLYCETAIKSRLKLHVPDALADPEWEDNPDVKLNMISYLGYPIMLPNDVPFGTLCILDNRANEYSEPVHDLILQFRNLIQHQLELLYMNQVLGEQNRRLTDHLDEIQVLRGLVPICAWCKKIRDSGGGWNAVETYLTRSRDSKLTHSICPSCAVAVEAMGE